MTGTGILITPNGVIVIIGPYGTSGTIVTHGTFDTIVSQPQQGAIVGIMPIVRVVADRSIMCLRRVDPVDLITTFGVIMLIVSNVPMARYVSCIPYVVVVSSVSNGRL